MFSSTWEPYWSFEADKELWGVLRGSLRPLRGSLRPPPGTIFGAKLVQKIVRKCLKISMHFQKHFETENYLKIVPKVIEKLGSERFPNSSETILAKVWIWTTLPHFCLIFTFWATLKSRRKSKKRHENMSLLSNGFGIRFSSILDRFEEPTWR